MTGRAIRLEGNGLGSLRWPQRAGGPFLFFALIVKASRQPVLLNTFRSSSTFLSPRSFWLHFVAVTFFTAAALTASHSFLRRHLSCFDNVKGCYFNNSHKITSKHAYETPENRQLIQAYLKRTPGDFNHPEQGKSGP
jgi:hypothetical protein